MKYLFMLGLWISLVSFTIAFMMGATRKGNLMEDPNYYDRDKK